MPVLISVLPEGVGNESLPQWRIVQINPFNAEKP
jgi:hypothetical protein